MPAPSKVTTSRRSDSIILTFQANMLLDYSNQLTTWWISSHDWSYLQSGLCQSFVISNNSCHKFVEMRLIKSDRVPRCFYLSLAKVGQWRRKCLGVYGTPRPLPYSTDSWRSAWFLALLHSKDLLCSTLCQNYFETAAVLVVDQLLLSLREVHRVAER